MLAVAIVAMAGQTTPRAPGAGPGLPIGSGGSGAWRALGDLLPTAPVGLQLEVAPKVFSAFALDRTILQALLVAAPLEGTAAARSSPLTVTVPGPDGVLQRFDVHESPVIEPELGSRYPGIRTYAGRGVDDETAGIRFDLTQLGFHASVFTERGAWYVDPYYHLDQSTYVSYWGKDLPPTEAARAERRPPEPPPDGEPSDPRRADLAPTAGGTSVTQRIYRLAFVTDPAYASHHGGTDASVLAAKTTLVNRLNQVYNDDLAVKMVLVAGTNALNLNTAAEYSGTNGPCGGTPCFTTTDCTGTILNQTRIALGQLVGASNYDIGHVGVGVGGGGQAMLGVVGGDLKARGCTGIDPPTGDLYAIDFVAHEIGHQFKANHTFNGVFGSCSTKQLNPATSVEPGSGSSVMAYAGICSSDNLQPHSDPYFSQRSIDEIQSYITTAMPSISEVQTASFTGFGGSDSFRLRFQGGSDSATITNGVNYSPSGIAAAIHGIPNWPAGGTVSVTGYAGGLFGLNGFQVTFGGTLANANMSEMIIVGASGFSGFVGETARGGPVANMGNTTVASGNHSPVVTAPNDATIPVRTPFALTGSVSDPNGNPVVNLWEQNDAGGSSVGTALTSNTKTFGPLFRQFGIRANVSSTDTLLIPSPGENAATSDRSRVFPDIAQIAAGNTNAASGSCPAAGGTPVDPTIVECYAEFLPTSSYADPLHFRLTARDRVANAGGVANDDVTLTLATSAGPFRVTSHASPSTLAGNSSTTVTWDVAQTNISPVNTSNVKISYSTDGGLTYPTVLAASTPNDGSQSVTVPNVATTQARFKVEAVGNVFFDISHADLTVTVPTLRTLTVVKQGTGSGTVKRTPDDGSINCGVVCTHDYEEGTSVVLDAVAAPGSTFEGWTTACSGVGSCNLTMSAAKRVEAIFNVLPACTITGTSGDDTLTGTSGNDTMCGLAGNDTFNGLGGSDTIYPGMGTANVNGGDGTDTVSFSNLSSGVVVNFSASTIAGPGIGGTLSNVENASGGEGTDTLTGSAASNTLFGRGGGDVLRGEGGSDVLNPGTGDDPEVNGGAQTDRVDYSDVASAVLVDLGSSTTGGGADSDDLMQIENVKGSNLADVLSGDGTANVIIGLGGNDVIEGGFGNDTLQGSGGNDSLRGQDGADILQPGTGDDPEVNGGEGSDTVDYSDVSAGVTINLTQSVNPTGGAGTDTYDLIENAKGTAKNDSLTGTSAPNTLRGLAGADTLIGAEGSDVLMPGAGDDQVNGGSGGDRVDYSDVKTGVIVNLDRATTSGGADRDTLSSVENASGTNLADTLVGSDVVNNLKGLKGDDVLNTEDGNPNDVADGGPGDDTCTADATDTTISCP